MATAGVLLSDLDGSGRGDRDIVEEILADMKKAPETTQRPLPPAMPAPTPTSVGMVGGSMGGFTMDSRIPSAHVIGNEHPTPADFAAAMHGANHLMGNPVLPGIQMQPIGQGQTVYETPSKNIYGKIAEEIKVPFVVALLFFVFSMPPIRVLVAHYLPSLIKPTGEFQITGLLAVSIVVGLMFWILQRVIAPLLSF